MKRFFAIVLFVMTAFANADIYSRMYIARLTPSGFWEYASVEEGSKTAGVILTNPNYGVSHKHTWEIGNHGKPGNTTDKVEEVLPKETSRFETNSLKAVEYFFQEKHGNYTVLGAMVCVWHYGDFSGVGYLVQFLMKSNVTEKDCIESFLNEEMKLLEESK